MSWIGLQKLRFPHPPSAHDMLAEGGGEPADFTSRFVAVAVQPVAFTASSFVHPPHRTHRHSPPMPRRAAQLDQAKKNARTVALEGACSAEGRSSGACSAEGHSSWLLEQQLAACRDMPPQLSWAPARVRMRCNSLVRSTFLRLLLDGGECSRHTCRHLEMSCGSDPL